MRLVVMTEVKRGVFLLLKGFIISSLTKEKSLKKGY